MPCTHGCIEEAVRRSRALPDAAGHQDRTLGTVFPSNHTVAPLRRIATLRGISAMSRPEMTRLWAAAALTPAGWQRNVSVKIAASGRIEEVQPDRPAEGNRCSLLLPAPANLHSHAFQRAMAGLAETRSAAGQDDFWSWRRVMYRFLAHLSPADVEAIAAFAQMEMLEAGYASVAEFHYLHHDAGGHAYGNPAEMSLAIAAAAAHSGIGLTLLPVLYQHGGCGGAPIASGQERFRCTRDQFAALLRAAEAAAKMLPADTTVGVAVHSLRAVGPEAMAWAEWLRPNAPFHMHLAEQKAEVDEVVSVLGACPVAWVLNNFDVSPRWCLVHCTQMNTQETQALAETGAVAGLCPVTESNLGDGIFRGVAYAQAGGSYGIGTDSNVRISLVEELRTLEYSQRLHNRTRAALALDRSSTGRALFEAACEAGALAAGRTGGNIAAGAWADLLELDLSDTNLTGLRGDALMDAWIFAGSDGMIRNVWAAGRHLVREGRHINRPAIERAVRPVLRRLRSL